MQVNNAAVLRLRVVAEADPGALVRTLQFFEARNLVPLRACARRLGMEFLEIEIEIDQADCTQDAFRLVHAKVSELPLVVAAVVCE
jgi:hypothetical protein